MAIPGNEGEPTDEELVERWRRGDRAAASALVRRYAARLLAFVRGKTRPGVDVENLVQEVWLRVARNIATFQNRHFRGWLFQITKNVLLDFWKKKGNSPHRSLSDADVRAAEQEAAAELQDDPKVIAMQECLRDLALESNFVRTVVRVKIDGETPERVAESENVTRATIDTRIYRGMKQLTDCVRGKLS